MESNIPQDLVALALQIQMLKANIEELTKQNQEMRQRVQQEENHSLRRIKNNKNEYEVQALENSDGMEGSIRTEWSDRASDDLLRSIKKEMDELKNAMKEKTTKILDWMVKRTNSPFTKKVVECPLPPRFLLPQLELYDDLKDLLDHITTFKMTLSL